MDIKELLLEKFIYVFNNSETIFEYIELSINNYMEKPFKYPQLEELLFNSKSIYSDNSYKKIEAFKKKADLISSYDVIHKIYVTITLFSKLIKHINNQKKDVQNQQNKLKIMNKYLQLLAYIDSKEIVKKTDVNIVDKVYYPKIVIYAKSQPLYFPKYKLIPNNKTYYCQVLNNEEKKDFWVKDNIFIKHSINITITKEDKEKVWNAVKREQEYIKKFEIIR
ncbi:MAG: hypothetical protein GX247_05205 [Mollicutes bacterium]|nr:hypothetical protein [Mollicutes bacterium]